jgi:predicted flap endonuclease-1-like 5' DNA nuclease
MPDTDALRDDLTSIDGVGDATAEMILDTLAEYGLTDPYLGRAQTAAERGDDREAAIYLRRALGDN